MFSGLCVLWWLSSSFGSLRLFDLKMGRKSFPDGPAMSVASANMALNPWLGSLSSKAEAGDRLITGDKAAGSTTVLPSVKNIALNAPILLPLARLKLGHRRLSAYPIDVYATLVLKFYAEHHAAYASRNAKGEEPFNPKAWSWEDGWALHKMFSRLRNKVIRDERPVVPCQTFCYLSAPKS